MSWEHRGIRGEGDPPPGVGKYKGTLLVIGSGRCVWDDLCGFLPVADGEDGHRCAARLRAWHRPGEHEIMAINQIGLELNCPLDHYASLHAGHLMRRFLLRQDFGLPCGVTMLHSDQMITMEGRAMDAVWPFGPIQHPALLSGGFAVMVAMALGYDWIVLAGCPNDGTGRYCDEPEQVGAYTHPKVMEKWQDLISNIEIVARVRSMSGNTREWLGGPQ